jgi:hypothetical protein
MLIWESERDSFRASYGYSVKAERSLVTIEGNNGVDLLLHSVSMNRRIRDNVEASLDSLEDKLRRKEDKEGTSVIGSAPRT